MGPIKGEGCLCLCPLCARVCLCVCMTHACTNQNQLKQEHEALVPVLEVIEGGLNNDGNGRTAKCQKKYKDMVSDT